MPDPIKPSARPDIQIVRGTPSPEELAALVGVLFGRARPTTGASHPSGPSAWVRSGRPHAGRRAGPGAWRRSGLPA